jgi:hypothetical protein
MSERLSDEQVKARVAGMTLAEKLALVEQCERMWAGTDLQEMAEALRALYEFDRMRLN